MASGGSDDKRAIADAIRDVSDMLKRLEERLKSEAGHGGDTSDLETRLAQLQQTLDDLNARLAAPVRPRRRVPDRMRDWRISVPAAALLLLALGALVYLAIDFLQPPRLSAEERRCAAYVQQEIPWDQEGSDTWDNSALARLCAGATNPTQPGLCFAGIFTADLERGAQIRADWKDAVALCAGTDDAQDSIQCYKREVGEGLHFRDAIESCNPPPTIAGRTACERLVQGNIAWNAAGNTTWTPRRLDLLCADTTRPTQPLICFDRLFHGAGDWEDLIDGNWRNAALLCAGTNSARQTSQCVSEQIAALDNAETRSPPQILDPGEDPSTQPQPGDPRFRVVLNACNPRGPSDRADQCKAYVQGNIPWTDTGTQDWQENVLDELCGKTRTPQQPGLCFFRAVNGVVDETAGLSAWSYAVKLCAGTNDADARLSCYTRERGDGKPARAVINACKDAAED